MELMECDSNKRGKSMLHIQRCLDSEPCLSALPFDLLKEIVFSAVKTSKDGARDFSRIRSVRKDFLRAAEDENLLKAIKFDGRIKASWQHVFSGHINGLAYRWAGAGNVSAHCLLAEEVGSAVFVISFKDTGRYSEGLASAIFFLSNFDFIRSPEYRSYDCVPRRSIHHVEVVRTFFLECSPQDVLQWRKIVLCMMTYCGILIQIARLRKVAKLFEPFMETIVKLSIPLLEEELVGLDTRVRAATEELKAGVDFINKRHEWEKVKLRDCYGKTFAFEYGSRPKCFRIVETLQGDREKTHHVVPTLQG